MQAPSTASSSSIAWGGFFTNPSHTGRHNGCLDCRFALVAEGFVVGHDENGMKDQISPHIKARDCTLFQPRVNTPIHKVPFGDVPRVEIVLLPAHCWPCSVWGVARKKRLRWSIGFLHNRRQQLTRVMPSASSSASQTPRLSRGDNGSRHLGGSPLAPNLGPPGGPPRELLSAAPEAAVVTDTIETTWQVPTSLAGSSGPIDLQLSAVCTDGEGQTGADFAALTLTSMPLILIGTLVGQRDKTGLGFVNPQANTNANFSSWAEQPARDGLPRW